MNTEADLKRIFNLQIGEISKKWTGLGEEMFTDADNFGVSFPKDLDIKVLLVFPKNLFHKKCCLKSLVAATSFC